MKFRRTASAVIISVSLIVLCLAGVLFLRLDTLGMEKVSQVVGSLLPQGEAGLSIDVQNIDSRLMRHICLEKTVVSADGKEVAFIDSIDVSLTLWDALKLVLGVGKTNADVSVNGLRAVADSESIPAVMKVVQAFASNGQSSDAMQDADPDAGLETPEGRSVPGILDRVSVSITARNMEFDVSYMGVSATVAGVNAELRLSESLTFEGAALNIPEVSADISALVGSSVPDGLVAVNDIRVSVDSTFDVYASVSGIQVLGLASLEGISAMAVPSRDKIDSAVYVSRITAFYDNGDVDIGGVINDGNATVSYSSAGKSLMVELSSPEIDIDSASLDAHLRLKDSGVSALIPFDGNVSVNISSNDLDALVSEFEFEMRSFVADIGANLQSMSAIGDIGISYMRAANLDGFSIEKLVADSLSLDFSVSSSGLGVRIKSGFSGESTNDLVGSFSFNADVSAQTYDFSTVDSLSLVIDGLEAASLPDASGLEVSMSEGSGLSMLLSVGDDIRSEVSYNSGTLDLRFFMTELVPQEYSRLYEMFLSGQEIVASDTCVEGSAVVSVALSEPFTAWMDNAIHLSFGNLDVPSVFELYDNARVSLNAAVRNLNIGSSGMSAAVTFESTMDRDTVDVQNLAVTASGMRLSYSGQLDLSDFLPVGRLVLQKSADGSELASMVFSCTRSQQLYTFLLQSPLLEASWIDGTLRWGIENMIVANATVVSPYIDGERLNLNVEVHRNPLEFIVNGDGIQMLGWTESNAYRLQGAIEALGVKLSDSLTVSASTGIDISYFTDRDLAFSVELDDLSVQVSDLLSLQLSILMTDSTLKLWNLAAGRGNDRYEIDGSASFEFGSIKEVLEKGVHAVKGIVNMTSKGGDSYVSGAFTGSSYSLDLVVNAELGSPLSTELSLLGTVDDGFFLSASADWGRGKGLGIDLNAQYRNKVLSLYRTGGYLGSLELYDFNFVIDASSKYLNAGLSFLNTVDIADGTKRCQSGDLRLQARLEGIATDLFQILAGLDYRMDFVLGLENVMLDDGYSIADTQADIVIENGIISSSGNIINGSFDLAEGYLDIDIDRSLLFGLKAQGYIGKEIDIHVSDLYLPLGILNQFLVSPMVGIRDGILEADLLLQGPASNPSFYGMGWCQSFAMDILYLPGQVISVKNLAFAVDDHRIVLTKTPFSSYSDIDGRYSYGNVSIEVLTQGLGLQSVDIYMTIDHDCPVDFWLPLRPGNTELEIRGDVSGDVMVLLGGGRTRIVTDIVASDTLVDFKVDNYPSWLGGGSPVGLDITLTTGKDIEFYYPDKDNPFLNFTLEEGKKVRFALEDGSFSTDGGIGIKSGQIFYFNNDFVLSEGSLDLSQKKFNHSSALPFVLSLVANYTDYDVDGNKVEISLILQDATLDNIAPRFTSTPSMSQNEILEILGQSFLSSSSLDSGISVASLASFAATATETLTRVGIIESNSNYSIIGTIRNAIGLDVFSARSNIVSNVIIDALPGELAGKSNLSMLARYLDGTSVYAGKNIGEDLFFRITLRLKADSNASRSDSVGHFLAKDLILDTQISLDLDNPIGTFTFFTKPQELSVFDILDTIGFSVTKQIQF